MNYALSLASASIVPLLEHLAEQNPPTACKIQIGFLVVSVLLAFLAPVTLRGLMALKPDLDLNPYTISGQMLTLWLAVWLGHSLHLLLDPRNLPSGASPSQLISIATFVVLAPVALFVRASSWRAERNSHEPVL